MPTYEYACRSCGQHLEVVQSFKDDPLTECPNCGGVLRKVFQPVGIAFKGSGFYKNDSRGSKKSTTASGSSSDGSSKSEAKSETKSESTPAEKKSSDSSSSSSSTSSTAAS